VVTPSGLNNLVDNVAYSRVPCSLVLEGNPTDDNRLDFESFPADGFEEAYNVQGYEEMAARRMPQPGYVVYRGGNWSTLSLSLNFRAGDVLARQTSLENINTSDLQGLLISMERKARWCQALQFPLKREAKGITDRILGRGNTGGFNVSALKSVSALQKLTRNDPPYVLVVIGSFLLLRTYVTACAIKWQAPFHPITAQPYGCEINLTFQRIDVEYPTWDTVRNSAGRIPQTPYNPRVRGEIVQRMVTSRGQEGIRAAANASTVTSINTAFTGA